MKFIAVLDNPDDVEQICVGMSATDITSLFVISVARQNFGIFVVSHSYEATLTSEYRKAAAKLIALADKIDSYIKETKK